MIAGFDKIELLSPWEKCDGGLEIELKKEVSERHILFKVEALSIARRTDNDDVLFFLPEHKNPLATIHLTWAGKQDGHSKFPQTVFFVSLENWIENCMKLDHRSW